MHRAKKFNTTELAFVIKSDNRIAKFNTEKLRTNIEQSFTSHNKVIDPKKIDAITNDILKDLAKYSNNGKITSAQIKDFLVKHLKKNTN
jgi:transcriptional regulator NrdR family protein